MHSIDESLRRLGTDYVDLYQIHRFDAQTPVEETLRALDDVVRAGKALYLGASSMYAWQLAKMLYTADRMGIARFATMQNYYNVVYREEEREMLPLCRAEGLSIIPFSPLARGSVAGNRRKQDLGDTVRAKTDEFSRWQYYHDGDFSIVDRVPRSPGNAEFPMRRSRSHGCSPDQPGITSPIIGTTKLNYLDDAVAALDLKLEEAELRSLIELYRPRGVLANLSRILPDKSPRLRLHNIRLETGELVPLAMADRHPRWRL